MRAPFVLGHIKQSARALGICVPMAIASAFAANASDKVTAAVSIGSKPLSARELEAALRAIIGNAPLRVVDPAAGIVETDAQSFNLMEADARLKSVRLVGVAAALESATGRQPTETVEWTIHFETVVPGGVQGAGVEISQDKEAAHSAAVTRQQRFKARPPESPPLGAGRLLVRALDSSGGEVARTVIDDPRILRVESADARGRLVRRRDIIRPTADFNVQLPFDARIVSIEISASDNGRGLRPLATVQAR